MKTKNIVLTTLIFVLSSFTLVAYSGSETRPVSPFQQVEGSNGINVIYSASNTFSLKVEAQDDVLSRIKTEVKNGVLKIYVDNKDNYRIKGKIEVYISAPTLDRINLSSGSSFITSDISNLESIRIDLSSGASVGIGKLTAKSYYQSSSSGSSGHANIAVSDVNINVSSGASFKLDGKTNNITLNCSSGAVVNIKNLAYETIDSHTSSGGSVSK
ncbi:GIN domain-containing protein [Dysgonomonas sp. ZJ709]|uniref:GIN domain-containing protein n=1 Tax=Dysgonomonas sp. ZJ709 TaxID=2709797 RepID=UPI0013ECA987|nr:DUF2807 domain-containing protein [Dysgonomonas sp. ZJ709]